MTTSKDEFATKESKEKEAAEESNGSSDNRCCFCEKHLRLGCDGGCDMCRLYPVAERAKGFCAVVGCAVSVCFEHQWTCDECEDCFCSDCAGSMHRQCYYTCDECVEKLDALARKLVTAVAHAQLSDIRRLLAQGADVNWVYLEDDADSSGDVPYDAVNVAIDYGNIEALRLLLEAGADLSACSDTRIAIVNAASQPLRVEHLKLLISFGADVNLATASGLTPLMAAALRGDVYAVSVLIDHGADINRVDGISGNSALELAETLQHMHVVQYIKSVGMRREHAALLDLQIAMTSLSLPMYICLDLWNLTWDKSYLCDLQRLRLIQGVYDSRRRILERRSLLRSAKH
jgi:hypothetical protein